MTPLDQSLFLILNHALKSAANDYWLGYATWLGNGWIGFPLAIIALFLLDKKRFGKNLIVLAIAGIVGGVALALIKNALHTPRPLTVFASQIATGKVYINVLFEPLYWNSFPSGHSQTVFTIATVLVWAGNRSGRLSAAGGIAIFAIAALVPLSRIYCGAHFPSDVAAGAILGTATAYGSCVSFAHIRFGRKSQSAIQATGDLNGVTPQ